jgi:hypothetical protein
MPPVVRAALASGLGATKEPNMSNRSMTTTGAPYALGLGRSRALVACASLAEASAIYRRLCDEHLERTGRGASTMKEGLVYDTTGATPRVIARVSWNGCCWSNRPWTPGDEPIYDPAAAQEEGAR